MSILKSALVLSIGALVIACAAPAEEPEDMDSTSSDQKKKQNQNKKQEHEQSQTTTSSLAFTLHGEGDDLVLEGTPSNANLTARYPNPQHVTRMEVHIVGGDVASKCVVDSKEVACDDTPFFLDAQKTATGSHVRVNDYYGTPVCEVDVPGGGPGDTCASTASRDEFCANMNEQLRKDKEKHRVNCEKLDEEPTYDPPKQKQVAKQFPNAGRCSEYWQRPYDRCVAQYGSCSSMCGTWRDRARIQLIKAGVCKGSPVVLDLDGDGIRLSTLASGVTFDLLGTGRVQTAWTDGADALLALDRNGNGAIDDATELFGNVTGGEHYEDGFAALRALDTNHDDVLDQRDSAYGQLLVWRDRDRDGVSAPWELTSLAAAGVRSLRLVPIRVARASSLDGNGNDIPLVSSFERTDGTVSQMVDAFFGFRPLD